MDILRPQVDDQRLVGKILEQVCIAKFQVNLHFSDSLMIQIEGPFSCVRNGGKSVLVEIDNNRIDALIGALETKVIEVSCNAEKQLKVFFEEGLEIVINTDDQYESYHLFDDGKMTTV